MTKKLYRFLLLQVLSYIQITPLQVLFGIQFIPQEELFDPLVSKYEWIDFFLFSLASLAYQIFQIPECHFTKVLGAPSSEQSILVLGANLLPKSFSEMVPRCRYIIINT